MTFTLLYTPTAASQRAVLEKKADKAWKAVRKALGMMEVNLKHPGLRTHKFESMSGPITGDVFESYAQNNTPGAYRIFWQYGPGKGQITVIAITPHP